MTRRGDGEQVSGILMSMQRMESYHFGSLPLLLLRLLHWLLVIQVYLFLLIIIPQLILTLFYFFLR